MDALKIIREVIASEIYPFLKIRYTIEPRILFKYRVFVFNFVCALSVWNAFPLVCPYIAVLPGLLFVRNIEPTELFWYFFAVITSKNNSKVVLVHFDVFIWVIDVSIDCDFWKALFWVLFDEILNSDCHEGKDRKCQEQREPCSKPRLVHNVTVILKRYWTAEQINANKFAAEAFLRPISPIRHSI